MSDHDYKSKWGISVINNIMIKNKSGNEVMLRIKQGNDEISHEAVGSVNITNQISVSPKL